MKNSDFFSSHNYLFLPTKQNPKVAMVVDDVVLAKNAFKLYNPFSLKAKFLKKVAKFFYPNIIKLGLVKKEKSPFIEYLENHFNQPLVVSIYFATVADKVVLQLQSVDAKVLGYLKYPLTTVGVKHIKNEIRAYEVLSSLNIVEPYLLSDTYNYTPFVFLKVLKGEIGIVKSKDLNTILDKFKRDFFYTLENHPRILALKESLSKNRMPEYVAKVENIIKNSTLNYQLVYEHGDFTPWNIVQVGKSCTPFDFEYFVEDGLEYFDVIKYYYQIGKLLKHKNSEELITFVVNKIEIQEIKTLFELFLIKEIVLSEIEGVCCEFEKEILEKLERV